VPHPKNKSKPQGLAFCFIISPPHACKHAANNPTGLPSLRSGDPWAGCLTQKTKASPCGLLFAFLFLRRMHVNMPRQEIKKPALSALVF
jgi:hypothetical protein